MTTLAQLFSSWPLDLGIAVAFFGLGMLVKRGVIAKQRKRILSLEDEMLANHSRILSLEKKLSDATADKNGVIHDYDLRATRKPSSDQERKIS